MHHIYIYIYIYIQNLMYTHNVFTQKSATWTTGQAKAGGLGVDLGRRGQSVNIDEFWYQKMMYGADLQSLNTQKRCTVGSLVALVANLPVQGKISRKDAYEAISLMIGKRPGFCKRVPSAKPMTGGCCQVSHASARRRCSLKIRHRWSLWPRFFIQFCGHPTRLLDLRWLVVSKFVNLKKTTARMISQFRLIILISIDWQL